MISLAGGTVDRDAVINAILEEEKDHPDDGEPVGLQEYYLSEHSKNIAIIEGFDFSDEWLKTQPALNEFLKEQLDDWWGDQTYDDPEVFRNWLDGNEIRVHPDSYLGTLVEELLSSYRKRITETWTCEECGKEISEKHPYGHPDCIHRLGIPDPEVYPDGKVPEGVPTDEVKYVNHIYCDRCWRKLFLNR